MIRICRIHDIHGEADRRRLGEVAAIFRRAFSGIPEQADKITELFKNRHELGYPFVLLTMEDGRERVLGFALAYLYPDIHCAYLDYIAIDDARPKRGIGGALYEALREYLAVRGITGLFMDVPPDQPELVADKARLRANRERLKFYERYGAYPILGTTWQEPGPGQVGKFDPPWLVYDALGTARPLSRARARKAVLRILTVRYGWGAEHPYTRRTVASIKDDPVRLRPPQYLTTATTPKPAHGRLGLLKLVVSDHHEIHHVRERGYVERPVRMSAILDALGSLPVDRRKVVAHGVEPIKAVHDPDFVNYLKAVCEKLEPGRSIYPYVFPIRRPERKPKEKSVRAGYYCIDTFTPLTHNAYVAARAAVDCALTGADLLSAGEQLVYALCRPPGHHAERRVFGGFCYFNNAAIAAHALSASGRVAFLDIDYHHGNGSQDIFYQRADVLFVSIHGHPNHSYPYFSGFADEQGEGPGLGFNRNYPLAEGIDDDHYLEVLGKAEKVIRNHRPRWLVVSLGFDIMRGDPTGSFLLSAQGMHAIGQRLGALELPTLVVQEGGYALNNLKRGAPMFFRGLAERGP